MGVFKVWVPSREHLSVQVLYDAAIVLYWKISERQNSTLLAFLKHQNIKTSLYKLSKNHWVITLFEIFGYVRRKLQSTVSLDHPVYSPSEYSKLKSLGRARASELLGRRIGLVGSRSEQILT